MKIIDFQVLIERRRVKLLHRGIIYNPSMPFDHFGDKFCQFGVVGIFPLGDRKYQEANWLTFVRLYCIRHIKFVFLCKVTKPCPVYRANAVSFNGGFRSIPLSEYRSPSPTRTIQKPLSAWCSQFSWTRRSPKIFR